MAPVSRFSHNHTIFYFNSLISGGDFQVRAQTEGPERKLDQAMHLGNRLIIIFHSGIILYQSLHGLIV